MERACIVSTAGKLQFDLPDEKPKRPAESAVAAVAKRILTVAEFRDLEADNIRLALEAAKGKIYGPDGAAAILRMKPTTLASKIKALGIDTPASRML